MRHLPHKVSNFVGAFLCKGFCDFVLLEHSDDTEAVQTVFAGEDVEFLTKDRLPTEVALLVGVNQNVRLSFLLL